MVLYYQESTYDHVGRPQPSTQQVLQPGYGFFTKEQEADETAAQLLAAVGIDPYRLEDAILAHLKLVPYPAGSPNQNYDECVAWRQRGWKDAQGTPKIPNLGNTSPPHHAECYRVYNVDRELAARKYQIAEKTLGGFDFAAARDAYVKSLPTSAAGEDATCPTGAICEARTMND